MTIKHSLTPVKAAETISNRVHLAVDCGTYDSVPLCGALRRRETETTDELSNCSPCKKAARAADYSSYDLYGLATGVGENDYLKELAKELA